VTLVFFFNFDFYVGKILPLPVFLLFLMMCMSLLECLGPDIGMLLLALLLCIWEISGLNLSSETAYLNFFMAFLSSST